MTVVVSKEITASPDVVWSMVSDLTRMGEWSPENN
ncbi:MAG: SRPBCC family protein, partial [Actinomycetes bacterium]